MHDRTDRAQAYSGQAPAGYGYAYRRRRTKADWAGVSLGDAFKANLDYYIRLPAQRLYYGMARKVQVAAAGLAGASTDREFTPAVKPQLGPCYTSYPATLAAYAALGLTGYLEFHSRAGEGVLRYHLAECLANSAPNDSSGADPYAYNRLAAAVTRSVETRLMLHDLARGRALSWIELYRLFSASQQTMKFRTVREIVDAVILYGDILPGPEKLELHPMTRAILQDVVETSQTFFELLATVEPHELLDLGILWVRELCARLARYLPREGDKAAHSEREGRPRPLRRWLGRAQNFRFAPPDEQPTPLPELDEIPPLDAPQPPVLDEPTDPDERDASLLDSLASLARARTSRRRKEGRVQSGDASDSDTSQRSAAAILRTFASAIEAAVGQSSEWEDMRADLVEQALRATSFAGGPIEGNPTAGHEVTVQMGNATSATGEVFDRPVELSDDLAAYEELMAESHSLTQALRRILYPNVEEDLETERLRTSGSLDPARLALAEFSPAVFKRYRAREKTDRRGRPILLIACDGSGSLNVWQMRMTKVLAAAWLESTARTGVQLLAGLYHSGIVRRGVSGPLVEWMYHPHKTPTTNRSDAARALVSLPDNGTGVQADALSLAFMLEEARRVAPGRMVYMIHITDCAWNKSLPGDRSGEEEVRSFFAEAYRQSRGKLHTTLVALGVERDTGLEGLVEKVITVSGDELRDYPAVAARIGEYVASCMTERRRTNG